METKLDKRKRYDGESDEYISKKRCDEYVVKRRCDDCMRVYIDEGGSEFVDTFDCISFEGVRCYVGNDMILNSMLTVAPTHNCPIEIVRWRTDDSRCLSAIYLSDILDCRPTLESKKYVVSNFKRFRGCWFANVTITGSDSDGYYVVARGMKCLLDTISENFEFKFDHHTPPNVSFHWE